MMNQDYLKAIYTRAGSLMPSTITNDSDKLAWLKNALQGKSLDQAWGEMENSPTTFGLNDSNVAHYAARHISEEENKRGIKYNMRQQVAVTDMFRQLAGADPLFYSCNSNGIAAPRDFFHELQIEKNGESGWRNFFANISHSVMKSEGGLVQLGAKLTDAVGVTENATSYWQDQMDELDRILAPQGGVSGTMGQLVGNTMFSIMNGGLGSAGGGAAGGITKGGLKSIAKTGWRGALKKVIGDSGGVGLVFGMAETGRRFGDVDKRRRAGQDIDTSDMLTYCLAGGAVEAAFEIYGWNVAKGFGRGIIKNLPGVREAIKDGGLKGGIKWATSLTKGMIGRAAADMPKGALEESATQFGQNLVDKLTEVVPDSERSEGLFTGCKESAIMGALQPLAIGLPMGIAGKVGGGISGGIGSVQTVSEQDAPAVRDMIKNLEEQYADIDKNPGLGIEQKEDLKIETENKIVMLKGVLPETRVQNMRNDSKNLPMDFIQSMNYFAEKGNLSPKEVDFARKMAKDIERKNNLESEAPISHKDKRGILRRLSDPILDKVTKFHNGQMRIDRICEVLDGGPEGPMYNAIYKPIHERTVAINTAVHDLEGMLREVTGTKKDQYDLMMKKQVVPGLGQEKRMLTGSEKIGIALLAARGDKGMTHLKGMDYSEGEVKAVVDSLSDKEKTVYDLFEKYYNSLAGDIAPLAKQYLGIDLKLEDFYAPIHVISEAGTNDMFDDMMVKALEVPGQVGKPAPRPEAGFTKEATGGPQEVGIDAVSSFLRNIRRFERFKNMLPASAQVSKILANDKLRNSVNRATRGTGSKLFDGWLEDATRGSVAPVKDAPGRFINSLRKGAVVYHIGYNILSMMRQPAAVFRAMALSPDGAARMLKRMLTIPPHKIKSHVRAVEAKSDYMRQRSAESIYNEQNISTGTLTSRKSPAFKKRAKSSYRHMSGQRTLGQRGLKLIGDIDQAIACLAWEGFYESEYKKSGDEKKALSYADRAVEKTQAAASIEQLPDFYRGGPVARLLSAFRNELNQNYNFFANEIIGAKKRGEIGMGNAMYRTIMSAVVPALYMGLINRARVQEGWEEALSDVFAENVGCVYAIGDMVSGAWSGYGGDNVASAASASASQAMKSIMDSLKGEKDWAAMDIAKPAIRAFGAAAGKPLGQAMRTAQGIIDLESGETDDIRRLVWSEYMLNGGQDSKKHREWWDTSSTKSSSKGYWNNKKSKKNKGYWE